MKKAVCLTLLAGSLFSCNKLLDYVPNPHAPMPEFNKLYGGSGFDAASSIVATSDGGYVMAGYTGSNDGDLNGNHENGDAWVIKLDKKGLMQWQKTLGGSGFDYIRSAAATTDGGYIIAVETTSTDGDVSGFHGSKKDDIYDLWMVKLDRYGTIKWQDALGGSGGDEAHALIKRPEGGYVIAGQTASNDGDVSGNHGNTDAWTLTIKDK